MIDIFIDMDGVLVDFYPAAEKHLGAPYRELPGATKWGILEKIDNFFRHLPMMHDAQQLWDGTQGRGRVRILTAAPRPTQKLATASADKIAWIRENISKTVPVIVVAEGILKAQWVTPNAILIDDLPRNIDAWIAAGGIGILHLNAKDTLRQLEAILPHV